MNDDVDTSVLVIDTETTGTTALDQIVELAVQYGFESVDEATGSIAPASVTIWRFKPTVPIHPGAQKVHGISAEMLAHEQPFKASAMRIADLLDSASVLIGFNIKFDLEKIDAEFARAGLSSLDLKGKYIVDAYRLWQQCEPRGLAQAHQRFVGGDFERAHSAAADIAATARVTLGMIDQFNLHGKDWAEIAELADPDRKFWLGGSNHFRWEYRNGYPPIVVVAFGKHKDTPLTEMARGYLAWMQKQDFPSHVKLICQKASTMRGAALLSWAASVFPPPAVTDGAP